MASKRLGMENIFIASSLIFIIIMIVVYGGRFLYYYKATHVVEEVGDTLLYSVVNKINSSNSQLKTSTDGTYYAGNVLNNYLYYSGRYYRILGVTNNKVRIVDAGISTILAYNNDYKESDIYNWLNYTIENTGIYYNSLYKPEEFLDTTKTCLDSYASGTITCNNYIESSVGLLSFNDYIIAKENVNYLDIDTYFWLSNKNKSASWYVSSGNELDTTTSTTSMYGVRAVLTLKEDVKYYGGSGTYYDPYTINNLDATLVENSEYTVYDVPLSDVSLGSYITYSDKVWRIIDNTDNIKLVAEESIGKYDFSTKTNDFNLNDKTGIAYYLNKTFYNTLNQDYLVKGKFYNESYSNSYFDKYDSNIEAYVGLLSVGDLFMGDYINSYTMTNTGSYKTIYEILDGRLYANTYKTENDIYPVIYITKDLVTKSGFGTKTEPYEVGEA